MIAGVLSLGWRDIQKFRITDDYSVHRIVYGLFEDVRGESDKQEGASSGILYADKGGNSRQRQILFLANRAPGMPEAGSIRTKEIPESFLRHEQYRFEVIVNPTKRNAASRRLIPIREKENIREWFMSKAASSWGFEVDAASLDIPGVRVSRFEKKGNAVTLSRATIRGVLTVTNQKSFVKSFNEGIGRGRAFGCGLLQIVPIIHSQICSREGHDDQQ